MPRVSPLVAFSHRPWGGAWGWGLGVAPRLGVGVWAWGWGLGLELHPGPWVNCPILARTCCAVFRGMDSGRQKQEACHKSHPNLPEIGWFSSPKVARKALSDPCGKRVQAAQKHNARSARHASRWTSPSPKPRLPDMMKTTRFLAGPPFENARPSFGLTQHLPGGLFPYSVCGISSTNSKASSALRTKARAGRCPPTSAEEACECTSTGPSTAPPN